MLRRVFVSLVLLTLVSRPAVARTAPDHAHDAKLDAVLRQRAHAPAGVSRVIVRTRDGQPATLRLKALGAIPGPHLASVGAQVARIPDSALHDLAAFPDVSSVSLDRPVRDAAEGSEPTPAAIGARWVNEQLGYTGKGIGVALIDSGVSAWHDDLDPGRVVHFVDFINFRPEQYDDYGHGTHVAGIIAGNGINSAGARRGIAPDANLIVLKALDGAGGGYISTVIAAIDYAIAHREAYNIRVLNLSVSAGVYESYTKDPLTLAAKRAVDAGMVVVAAAGNLGRSSDGRPQYGGIAAPGNAPWVLTVGASNHKGTAERADDEVAEFSSRGPAAIDRTAKPDLLAPGVGIQSLAEPSSVLFSAHPEARLWGTRESVSQPYLSLSGTSMAAPVVAATAALMLEANPSLTPNAVKAILQFTAEAHSQYDDYTEGAGFLNARGAVALAAYFRASPDGALASPGLNDPVRWSRRLIWGGQTPAGGMLTANANAWHPAVVWGSRRTPAGGPIVWGTLCAPGEEGCDTPWTNADTARTERSDRNAGAAPGEAETWFWSSTPDTEHGFVVAGSVQGGLIPVITPSELPGVVPPLPSVRSGWPLEEIRR